jgi:hypothetical protein
MIYPIPKYNTLRRLRLQSSKPLVFGNAQVACDSTYVPHASLDLVCRLPAFICDPLSVHSHFVRHGPLISLESKRAGLQPLLGISHGQTLMLAGFT